MAHGGGHVTLPVQGGGTHASIGIGIDEGPPFCADPASGGDAGLSHGGSGPGQAMVSMAMGVAPGSGAGSGGSGRMPHGSTGIGQTGGGALCLGVSPAAGSGSTWGIGITHG
jgi:hypothetical protein